MREKESWRETVVAVAARRATGEGKSGFQYRLEHVKAVVRVAEALAHLLGADLEVVTAAAWLHDLAKRRDRWPEGDDHGPVGGEEAGALLSQTDFPQDKIPEVVRAIALHAGLYKDHPIEPLEAAILWDADKLSKLGATAIVHSLALDLERGDLTTEDVLSRGREWLELAKKIASSMTTDPAKAMARDRYRVMEEFYIQLERELRGDGG